MTYLVETFTEEKSVGILHIWCKSIGFTAVTLGIKVPVTGQRYLQLILSKDGLSQKFFPDALVTF